jgi:arsenite oxidase large subunit
VMHLAINSGTDLALFNAWFTYINDKVGPIKPS